MRTSILSICGVALMAMSPVPSSAEVLHGDAATARCREFLTSALGGRQLILGSDEDSAVADFAVSMHDSHMMVETIRLGGRSIFVFRVGERKLPLVVAGNDWAFFLSSDHPGALHYVAGSNGESKSALGRPEESSFQVCPVGLGPDPVLSGVIRVEFQWFADRSRDKKAVEPAREEVEASITGARASAMITSPESRVLVALDNSLAFPISDSAVARSDGDVTSLRIDAGSAVPKKWADVTPERIFAIGRPVITLQASAIQWKKRSSPDFFKEVTAGHPATTMVMDMMKPFMRASEIAVEDPQKWPPAMVAAAEALSACLPPPQPIRLEAPTPPAKTDAPVPARHPLPDSGDVVVPLECGSSPVLRVRIEGSGEHWFLLDTGATDSMITPGASATWPNFDRPVGASLTDSRSRRGDVMTIESPPLSIGSWKIGKTKFVVSHLPALIRQPLAGVIGCDLLGEHPFTIDPEAGTLTFHAREGFVAPADARQVAITSHLGRPMGSLRLEGLESIDALLDTGMTHDLSLDRPLEPAEERTFSGLRRWRSWTSTPSGLVIGSAVAWPASRSVELFGRRVGRDLLVCRIPAVDVDGVVKATVGFPLLRRHRLTFDLSRGKLWAASVSPRPLTERLASGWKIDELDACGDTALMRAIAQGERQRAEELVTAGAAFAVPGARQHPMMTAVDRGDPEFVRWIDAVDTAGTWKKCGALTLAIHYGLPDIAEWLISQGIDLAANEAAMLEAAKVGDIVAATRLRRAGMGFATVSAAALPGVPVLLRSPLMQAVFNDQSAFLRWAAGESAEALREVISEHRLLSWSLYAGHSECTRVLLEAGLDPAEPEGNGYRPLDEAVISGRHEMLDLMLAKPGLADMTDHDGDTFLMLAAQNGFLECLKVILARQPDLDRRNHKGYTALHLAALGLLEKMRPERAERSAVGAVDLKPVPESDYPGCVLALLKAGADPHLRLEPPARLTAAEIIAGSAWGRQDLFAACFPEDIDPAKAPFALGYAAEADNAAMVELLLKKGYDPNAPNPIRATPLHAACAEGSTGSVLALLTGKADVNARRPDGFMAIHLAARHNDALLIRALVRAGADPDAEDGDGNTPLCHAVEFRALASVRALLAAGADPGAGAGSLDALERAKYLSPKYSEITDAMKDAASAERPAASPRGQ